MTEPQMPVMGALPDNTGELNQTNETIPETNQPVEGIVETPEGEKILNEAPTPPKEEPIQEDPNKAVFESWREDRERLSSLDKENLEMREKLARYESEDEELSNLPEEERVEKLVERREAERKESEAREKKEVESEMRWYRLQDPFFKENEQRILKNAVEFNSKSLSDAIKITKQQDDIIKQTIAEKGYQEKQKKNANGAGASSSSGKFVPVYDPKVDGKKSIADIYREGGV